MQKYMYKVDNRWNTSLYTNMNLQASNKPEKIFWIKTCIVLQEKKKYPGILCNIFRVHY